MLLPFFSLFLFLSICFIFYDEIMGKLQQKLSTDHPLLQWKLLSNDTKELLGNLQDDVTIDSKILTMVSASYDHPKIREVTSLESINNLFVVARENLNVDTMQICIDILQKYLAKYSWIQEELFICTFMEENNIDKMDDRFHALSEDMRLLIAKQFAKEQKYNFGCGGSFGYFKTPTWCGWCISGKESLELAKLDHLAVFRWDRQYSIPKEKITQAQNTILSSHLELEEEQKNYLEKIIDIYAKQLTICENIIQNKIFIEKIQKTNSSLTDKFIVDNLSDFLVHIQWVKDNQAITVDPNHLLAAYIQWTSSYNWSGWSEYGNYIAVWYAGLRKDVHVVYRDRYDSAKDDWSLCFSEVVIESIKKIDDQLQVSVCAKSNEAKKTYSFTFPIEKVDISSHLGEEEQKSFLQNFDEAQEKCVLDKKKRYSGNTMPFYCLPAESQFQNMSTNDISYQEARIMSSASDKLHGKWVVVIKTQIDHSAGAHKMQREWEVFLVEHNKTIRSLQRECRWYNEIKDGDVIDFDAERILRDLL